MAEIPLVSVHINAGVLRPARVGAHTYVSAGKTSVEPLCAPKAELALGALEHNSRKSVQQRTAQNCPDKWEECYKKEKDTTGRNT